jgi:hypothetical protein
LFCENCGAPLAAADEPVAEDHSPEDLVGRPDAEEVYFADGQVRITRRHAVLGEKRYALAEIWSAAMELRSASRLPSLLLAGFGAALALTALADLWNDPLLGILLTVGGLILLGIGLLLTVITQQQYILCLGVGEEQVDAFSSPERARVERIVQAIRQAQREGSTQPEA